MNTKFKTLLYGLSKAEWLVMLGEDLGQWLTCIEAKNLRCAGAMSAGLSQPPTTNKLVDRKLLDAKGCYTQFGVDFINWLFTFTDKRLPLPAIKNLLPQQTLSVSDKDNTFDRVVDVLKKVVSNDDIRPVINCALLNKDGIVATNGHILMFVGYDTGRDTFLYDPVAKKQITAYKAESYPKWQSIPWDVSEAKKKNNVLVLETYSRLKPLARLFSDDQYSHRHMFIGKQNVAISYTTKLFKVLYDCGVTSCDMYQKGDDDPIILKGNTKGVKFLGLLMSIRIKDGALDGCMAKDYRFEDLVEAQQSEGFLGQI